MGGYLYLSDAACQAGNLLRIEALGMQHSDMPYRVGEHGEAGPGGGDAGGVLPRKEHRNQHACDFLLCHLPAAVHGGRIPVHKYLRRSEAWYGKAAEASCDETVSEAGILRAVCLQWWGPQG